MKRFILLSGMFLITLASCGLREKEDALNKRMSELAQKEQELLLREKSLQLKEKELNEREILLDSTSSKLSTDSLSALHPKLPGIWLVKMTCTETTCPGSAIGDTKTEQWIINYQNNAVIAKAMSNNNLARIYIGTYSGNSLELSAQQDTAAVSTPAKMIVHLQETKEDEMEGEREITRVEGCRIVYTLKIKRQ
jgi:hypothetical protein